MNGVSHQHGMGSNIRREYACVVFVVGIQMADKVREMALAKGLRPHYYISRGASRRLTQLFFHVPSHSPLTLCRSLS